MEEVLHDLARQKDSKILEGHLHQDHVHVLISIPPKYSAAQVVGYIKGKSTIHAARTYLGQKKNYGGMSFWARGYFCATVGQMTDGMIQNYLEHHFQPNLNDNFKMEPD